MKALPIERMRWKEFLRRLEGDEGCDFRVEKGKTIWNCEQGGLLARAILGRMGYDDDTIDRVMAFCRRHGGYCDCEIIFNVENSLRRRPRTSQSLPA